MFRFGRWYNENKNKLWSVILIIVAIIFFIQVINNFYINRNKNKKEPNISQTTKNTIENEISGKLEGTGSLINGSGSTNRNIEKHTLTIDTFIKHCNEGQVEEAYKLLTEECKEEIFPSLESFTNKYFKNVFKTYKTYSIQNWMGSTYKIKLTEDALTTGKVNSNSSYLQEYITVVEKGTEYKLNINNYIGRTQIDKTTNTKGLNIIVESKETYMDYSEYTIKIQNNTEKTILLDNGKRANNIYLLDANNVEEYANTGEIIYSNLRLIPREIKKYTFKFSNSYSNTRVMKYFVLKNVIMDYDEYDRTMDKNNYDNITKITVGV